MGFDIEKAELIVFGRVGLDINIQGDLDDIIWLTLNKFKFGYQAETYYTLKRSKITIIVNL